MWRDKAGEGTEGEGRRGTERGEGAETKIEMEGRFFVDIQDVISIFLKKVHGGRKGNGGLHYFILKFAVLTLLQFTFFSKE